jgi:peptide/nickel transport system substrate-binding protein
VANSVGTFDPHGWGGFTSNIVTNHVFQGLVRLNFDTNQVEPALAESWETPDKTTWIYHLRKGVTFHDGTPFTAADVVFSTKRSLKVSWGTYGFSSFDSIKALDDHTVQVKLKNPDWRFQWAYYWPPGAILSKAYFDKVGEEQAKQKPIGTNAFKLERSSSTEVVLSKYAGYWESGLPHLDEVVLNIVDGSTITQGLKTGDVKLSPDVDFDQLKLVSGFGGIDVKARVGPHIVCTYPNQSKPPFDDVNARRAVMEALDNPGALSAYPTKYYEPSKGALIHSSFQYNAFDETNAMYTGDLTKAKQLLQASRTPDGATVDWLVVATRPQEVSAVLGAQERLAKIGIKVNVKQLPDADVAAAIYKQPRPYTLATYNWLHNQPNTLDPLAALFSSGSAAWLKVDPLPPQLAKLVDESVKATDEAAIAEKLRQLQVATTKDAHIFPHGWDALRRAETTKLKTPKQSILAEWDDWFRTAKWA